MKNTIKLWCAGMAACLLWSAGHSQNNEKNSGTDIKAFCGSMVPGQQWENELQAIIAEIKKTEKEQGKSQAAVYTIPVIMHVIHGGQTVGTYPNLAQGQLVSQIRVLNDDYGGIGYNSWNYPPTAFSSWAVNQSLPGSNIDALGRVKIANFDIQFCLATTDTLGNTLPEPGIDRINYVSKGWNNPGSYSGATSFQNYMNGTVKPQSIWNVKKYLNIWVSDINFNSSGLLGYATFPAFSSLNGIPGFTGSATTDGFWCYARAFGSVQYFPGGTYLTNYTRGRTSTHEIGHWLGLRHIWGDSNCGNDFCSDTPPASASNNGSPSYPYKTTTCSGSNTPNGEMFMNFMDYTNDDSKYMFTPDQAARAQAAMSSSPYRKFLGTHNLCSVAPVAASATFNMPATACGSAVVTLSNQTSGTPLPSYTWAANGPGSVSFIPNNSNALAVSFSTPGTYTVTLVANNGNNTAMSKVITIGTVPVLTVTALPQATVCYGQMVTLDASGANSYAWQPGAQLGSNVSYQIFTSGVYTVVGTGPANCKATSTISIELSDCTGLVSAQADKSGFRAFPNPVHDKLFIESTSGLNEPVSVNIYDALGRLILSQSQTSGKAGVGIDVVQLPTGVYVMNLISGSTSQTFRMVKE